MTFGERLRKARKDKGFTQKQLADLIGAKHNSISDWENNKNRPDPDTIEYICGALEIPVSRLFSESVQNKKSPELTEVSPGDDKNKQELLQIYDELNADGQTNMMTYAQFLSSQPQYKKCQNISNVRIFPMRK